MATSTIDKLPSNVRDDLIAWLKDPAIDYDEATERVNKLLESFELDDLKVSRSAVGRKGKKIKDQIEEAARVTLEKRAAAKAFYEIAGDSLDDGGKFVAELLQASALNSTLALMRLQQAGEDVDVHANAKTIKNLTTSVSQTEQAISAYTKREDEILRQEQERASAKLEELSKGSGNGNAVLNKETLRKIREEVYGIYT